MPDDDWYRNTEWNQEVEDHFRKKLNCSRSQRDQYLVIQALTISERHPETSLNLIDEYFASKTSDFEDLRALYTRVSAHTNLGNIENTIQTYVAMLELEKRKPNQSFNTQIEFPYYVAFKNLTEYYGQADLALTNNLDDIHWPIHLFKWHAAKAIFHQDKNYAIAALEAARIDRSKFKFHRKLGIVGEEHKDMVKQLYDMCK
ncbi:MAG: hypothetical protein OCD76_19310 [Reichenbachiella sp.]